MTTMRCRSRKGNIWALPGALALTHGWQYRPYRSRTRDPAACLLGGNGEEPMSENEIRRALSATKKTQKLAVIDALSRLDGAGLVDRRGDLAVASAATRRFDRVMTL